MATTKAQIDLLVNTAGSANSLKEFRQQISEIQKAISEATDPADIQRLQRALGTARDEARDFSERLNIIAGNKFEAATKGLQTVAGGFAAAQGAAALFGGESEELEKTLVKVQGALALSEGLGQLAEAPRVISNVAAAFGLVSAAKTVDTAATEVNTVATIGLGNALKALGIGLIISAVAALVIYWDDLVEAAGKVTGGTDNLKQSFNGIINSAKEIGSTLLTFVATPYKALWKLFTEGPKAAMGEIEVAFNKIKSFPENVAKAYSEGKAEKAQEQALEKQISNLEIANTKLEKGSLQRLNNEKRILELQLSQQEKGSKEYLKIQDDLTQKIAEIEKKKSDIVKKEQDRLQKIREDQVRKEQENFEKLFGEKGIQKIASKDLSQKVDLQPIINPINLPKLLADIDEQSRIAQEGIKLSRAENIQDIIQNQLFGIDSSIEGMTAEEKTAAIIETVKNTFSQLTEVINGFYALRLQELDQQKQDELDLFDAATEKEIAGVAKGSEAEKNILQRRQLEREKLERDFDKKARATQKEQALFNNRLSLLQAIANGAAAVINAFKLDPTGILAGFVGAVNAAQVGLIIAQGEQISKIKAAKGGLLTGPSHAEGGIVGTGRFGNIEVEGGEFIVNKEATMRNLPLLSAINRSSFEVATPQPDMRLGALIDGLDKLVNSPLKAYVLEQDIENIRDKREFLERRTTIN